MTIQITPHPSWVSDLDVAVEDARQAILDTPVVVEASENRLQERKAQNFLVAFYPIVRDFPRWLEVLLERSPEDGRAFFRDNIRVERRHDMCRAAPFASAVAATNYAVEGVAQKISSKALRGLEQNAKIGPRGRWWLEEHAKYDDEHSVWALAIMKNCVAGGASAAAATEAARRSLALMQPAMVASYGP